MKTPGKQEFSHGIETKKSESSKDNGIKTHTSGCHQTNDSGCDHSGCIEDEVYKVPAEESLKDHNEFRLLFKDPWSTVIRMRQGFAYYYTCYFESCHKSFRRKTKFKDHLYKVHNYTFTEVQKQFESEDSFHHWKETVEAELNVEYNIGPYRRRYGRNYVCTSSGRAKSGGRKLGERTRVKKLDFLCTSYLNVYVNENGKVTVSYVPLHYGHPLPNTKRTDGFLINAPLSVNKTVDPELLNDGKSVCEVAADVPVKCLNSEEGKNITSLSSFFEAETKPRKLVGLESNGEETETANRKRKENIEQEPSEQALKNYNEFRLLFKDPRSTVIPMAFRFPYNYTCYFESCHQSFRAKTKFKRHLYQVHNYTFPQVEKQFESEDSFYHWKKTVETELNVEYDIDTYRQLDFPRYVCTSSGRAKNAGKTRQVIKRIRARSLDVLCTSYMNLYVNENGRVTVSYVPLHYGHPLPNTKRTEDTSVNTLAINKKTEDPEILNNGEPGCEVHRDEMVVDVRSAEGNNNKEVGISSEETDTPTRKRMKIIPRVELDNSLDSQTACNDGVNDDEGPDVSPEKARLEQERDKPIRTEDKQQRILEYELDAVINRDGRCLEVKHDGLFWSIGNLWLKDHCRCEDCYDSRSYRRRRWPNNKDMESEILLAYFFGNSLCVKWSDDHESVYSWSWLSQVLPFQAPKLVPLLWNVSDAVARPWATVLYEGDSFSKKQQVDILKSLSLYGLAIIQKVEPSIEATQKVVSQLLPIMKTVFGKVWDVTTDIESMETCEAIGLHTDTTFYTEPAALEVFHLLSHEGAGGFTQLVDGFHAAAQLRENDPDAYELLSTVNIPSEYIEPFKNHYYASAPIFQHSYASDLERVRFNMYERAAMSHLSTSEYTSAYAAMSKFRSVINDTQNVLQLRLSPGYLLIVNNWRILNATTSFTGTRWMCRCFASRSEYLNACRKVGLL